MQLRPKSKRKIGSLLARASLALICATTNVAKAQDTIVNPGAKSGYFSGKYAELKSWAKWSGEVGFLGYSETEGRVQALEPAVTINAEFENEKVWSTKLVLDSLTGASPNGALVSGQPQTFTTPSGKSNYTTKAGDIPLDDTFKDTRVNVSTSWSQPLSRTLKGSVGLNFSTEYDYVSLGLNTSLTKESDDKNTSYTAGLAYTNDKISAVGGTPIPLAAMAPSGSTQARDGSDETKSTYDLLLGMSQVINRSWIVQANLSLGYSTGYLNDPYKIVTIFDDAAGPTLGDAQSYIFENRPDKRFKQSLYLASKNNFKLGILTTSYRFFTDDWGLSSHTVESSFNYALSKKWHIEPGLRVYKQSAVDFYDFAIGNSEALPKEVTADNRLGDMMAITPSIKFIRKLQNEKEMSLILRYYSQTGDSSPSEAIGSQKGKDLFPKVDAFIVHLNYSF